jgi:undecaprenyl-diphosphatase
VTFLVGAAAIWLSSALLEAVLDNATIVRWDVAAAEWVHAHVTPRGTSVSRVISHIGSPRIMGYIAVLGGLELLRRRRKTLLIAWIAAFAGGGMLEKWLKVMVHRTRPVFNTSSPDEQSLSFPSGHSMMCLIGMAMVVYVLTIPGQVSGIRRSILIGVATAFVLSVGISRVYLSAHFPTDVIGGFAAGAGWVAICVGVRGIVKHHRHRRSPAKAKRSTKHQAVHASAKT